MRVCGKIRGVGETPPVDLYILHLKQPSAPFPPLPYYIYIYIYIYNIIREGGYEVNPANQLGSGISWAFTSGLLTGVILGKDSNRPGDKPQFKEALKLRIFFVSGAPSSDKCSLLFIRLIISLKI